MEQKGDRFEAISQKAIDTALPNVIVAKWNEDHKKTKTVDMSGWKPSVANVVTRLLRREHAALVRAVKRLPRYYYDTYSPCLGVSRNDEDGQVIMLRDVLALLAGRKDKP